MTENNTKINDGGNAILMNGSRILGHINYRDYCQLNQMILPFGMYILAIPREWEDADTMIAERGKDV